MQTTARIFSSNAEAFAFACQSMEYTLRGGNILPALVDDASTEFLTPTAIKRKDDGHQIAVLKVPSEDGVVQVIGETATANGPKLAVGDLVQWRCGAIATGIWFGLIIGRLAPELQDGGWRLGEPFG